MTAGATTEQKSDQQEIPVGNATESPSLMVLASDAVTVAKSFVELAALELRLALQSLPKILGLLVVAFLLALFTWLSFSTAVGWLVYSWLGSAGWGIAGFLLTQIVALIACRFLIATYIKRASLPHTRDFVKNIQENFRDAAR
jgi:uncharacterized membrane protein YqjE